MVTRNGQALSVVERDGGMTLRFWGVRGSLPAPGLPRHVMAGIHSVWSSCAARIC